MSDLSYEMELRELDARIAEQVMGWRHANGEIIVIDADGLPWWFPSIDIAAAWEVVERIFHKKGWSLWPLSAAKNIEDDSPAWYATGWGIYESSGIDLHGEEIAIDRTAPLAICRAALKAIGR